MLFNVQEIGSEEGIMERWNEYFEVLLQGGSQQEEEATNKDMGQHKKRRTSALRKLSKP